MSRFRKELDLFAIPLDIVIIKLLTSFGNSQFLTSV